MVTGCERFMARAAPSGLAMFTVIPYRSPLVPVHLWCDSDRQGKRQGPQAASARKAFRASK